jgi:hypothetical protein
LDDLSNYRQLPAGFPDRGADFHQINACFQIRNVYDNAFGSIVSNVFDSLPKAVEHPNMVQQWSHKRDLALSRIGE